MHAVQIDRDVAVDDVAVEQRAVVGDAVADDLVDRGAHRLRESLVVQRARIAAARDARLVADAIELVGRHADLHRVGQLEQDLAPGPAGGAHAVGELVGRDRGDERRARRARTAGGESTPAPGDRPRGDRRRTGVPPTDVARGGFDATRRRGLLFLHLAFSHRQQFARCRDRRGPRGRSSGVDHRGRGHRRSTRASSPWPTSGASASSSAASIAVSQASRSGPPITNGAWRIRSRGWPFSSLYVGRASPVLTQEQGERANPGRRGLPDTGGAASGRLRPARRNVRRACRRTADRRRPRTRLFRSRPVHSSFVRQQWLHASAETRPTPAKGTGVFARRPIPANTTVAGFGGVSSTVRSSKTLGEAVRIHALQIDDDLFLASTPPFDPADFVNHSCDPNCGIVGSVLLVTMRDVEAGEELCFDYAMTDSDDYDMFECSCGTDAVSRRRSPATTGSSPSSAIATRVGTRRTSHAGSRSSLRLIS